MLNWKRLYSECYNCNKCNVGYTRDNVVFGEGNPK